MPEIWHFCLGRVKGFILFSFLKIMYAKTASNSEITMIMLFFSTIFFFEHYKGNSSWNIFDNETCRSVKKNYLKAGHFPVTEFHN